MKYEAFFWMVLLGLTTSYVAWTLLRGWLLRMDLFNVRDRLWLEMYRSGDLFHPAHRDAARTINGIIQFVPSMSFATLIQVDDEERRAKSHRLPEATRHDAPKPVKQAVVRTVRLLNSHILLGGLLGWSVCIVFVMIHSAAWLDRRVSDFCGRFILSERVQRASDSPPTHPCF
jgi:hypothetical protein